MPDSSIRAYTHDYSPPSWTDAKAKYPTMTYRDYNRDIFGSWLRDSYSPAIKPFVDKPLSFFTRYAGDYATSIRTNVKRVIRAIVVERLGAFEKFGAIQMTSQIWHYYTVREREDKVLKVRQDMQERAESVNIEYLRVEAPDATLSWARDVHFPSGPLLSARLTPSSLSLIISNQLIPPLALPELDAFLLSPKAVFAYTPTSNGPTSVVFLPQSATDVETVTIFHCGSRGLVGRIVLPARVRWSASARMIQASVVSKVETNWGLPEGYVERRTTRAEAWTDEKEGDLSADMFKKLLQEIRAAPAVKSEKLQEPNPTAPMLVQFCA